MRDYFQVADLVFMCGKVIHSTEVARRESRRSVAVTERRTAIDFAKVLRELAAAHFSSASRIALVQSNLNTHTLASLYEAFVPAEARRSIERFEWRYTPRHGS